MARVRSTKYRYTSSKNQPKVAFFHNNNFDDFTDTFPVKKTSGKKVNVVALNKDQEKSLIEKIGSLLNNKIFRFHK